MGYKERVGQESGFDVRVSKIAADEMVSALRKDFEEVRSSLVRYGLELTLAGELLSARPSMTERNVCTTASRCLAISRLASLLESAGIALPAFTLALETEWHRERMGSSNVA
jgi:hypothetical protein